LEDLVLLSLAVLARDSSGGDFGDGTNRPALRERRQRVRGVLTGCLRRHRVLLWLSAGASGIRTRRRLSERSL